MKINNVPIYTCWKSIYPGPHINEEGLIDERIWFSVPIELNLEEDSITYLLFPYGGSEEEVTETKIEAYGSWTV